jgi:hypothetical protein
MTPCKSCLLSGSSNCRSQHYCDVCKYMFRMDQSNRHNNHCSNHVFKVYAYCHHCSTVHEVPHRLGSTMLSLSTSSLSNTSHHSFAPPTAVKNESTFSQGDDDMHNNNDNSMSNVVDNDSNCLRDTSDSNESSSFHKGSSTHGDSKVSFNGLSCTDVSSTTTHPRTRLSCTDVSSTTTHPRTRLGSYLIIQMTSLSLLNSRYHHHAYWTWVHTSLSSCCS